MPEPGVPDETVRKLALLWAVHAQPVAAVTGIVPDVAAALTPVVTAPTVMVHDEAEGVVEDVEHAAATTATAEDTTAASSRRWYLIRQVF